jgi:hemerythrin-like domain-containing protein
MPRLDLFTSIHKAIRAMVYDAGSRLQTADFADNRTAAKTTAHLVWVLSLMREHHDTEEEFVFPQVRPYDEALIDELQSQHRTIETLLALAGDAVVVVDAADPWSRQEAGVELNRRFNELVAFYLQHLAHEEVTVVPVTWEHFSDDQLGAIQDTILASMRPQLALDWLGWMFRGLNQQELVGMLAGAKVAMPEPALEEIKDLGAATLDPERWAAVREQAGL